MAARVATRVPLLVDSAMLVQRRWWTPPSRRTWSKVHHRIRVPRPMVDRLDIARELPQKEWWRERRVAPATFFGFPDVTKKAIRGGELYVEQMDAVTLAVLADKCVQEHIKDPEIWERFAWRAQQLCSRTHEPDLCYIFRAFARMDWFDRNLLTTYLGRLHRRLGSFQLPDAVVFLEAFANPRFRQGSYLNKVLTHLALLLQHRDDATAEDLARCCAALRQLWPQPPDLASEILISLELLSEGLLLRELSELDVRRMVQIVDACSTWGLLSSEGSRRSTSACDLSWALARELKGRLRVHSKESPGDLATLALAMGNGPLAHVDLWRELLDCLPAVAHRLSGPDAAAALHGVAKGAARGRRLYEALGRRLAEEGSHLSALDCARAAGGLFRTSARKSSEPLNAVFERVLHLGLENFDTEALAKLFDALSRAPEGAPGAEPLAGATLEVIAQRLEDFSARQLATIVLSLGHLQPHDTQVTNDVLDRLQVAATSEGADLQPRHFAMIFSGLCAQPEGPCRVQDRLAALMPQVIAAMDLNPTAVSTMLILSGVALCVQAPELDALLSKCAGRLAARCCDLSAAALCSLCRTLEELRASPLAWQAPDALLCEVSAQLDIKRYDIKPDSLREAAQALAGMSCSQSLPLED